MTIYPKYVSKARKAKIAGLGLYQAEVAAPVDWEKLRPQILEKSDGCYLCGEPLNLETMTTDHAVIQKMGQRKNNRLSNLMPCCGSCNVRKGSRRLNVSQCSCGQKWRVQGLPCLRCERLGGDMGGGER